jgi:tetratricopeptide (TPR) repeat protein
MNHYQQSLEIRQKSLPSEHLDIASSFRSIGLVYERLREWEQALKYYQEACSIYRHSLSPQHPVVIELQRNIQRVSLHLYK